MLCQIPESMLLPTFTPQLLSRCAEVHADLCYSRMEGSDLVLLGCWVPNLTLAGS